MSTSQADVTFDRYVLNFRDELQSAARDCLTSLELQIKDEGDDWLEAHIESLFSTSNEHGPILEHLKTPSRTATAKKTRAKLEAEKQRTDKLKSVNARLALSPSPRSVNAGPARLLFQQSNNSPLQPRSMNAGSNNVAVPLTVKSPKGKAAAPPVLGKPAPIKAKASSSENRSDTLRSPIRSQPSHHLQQVRSPQQAATRQPVEIVSPVTRSTARVNAPVAKQSQSPPRPAKSPLRHAASSAVRSPVPVPKTARPQSPTPQNKSASSTSTLAAPALIASGNVGPAPHKDLSMIMEGDSETSSGSRARSPTRQKVRSPVRSRPQSPRSGAKTPTSPRSGGRQPSTVTQQLQPSIDAVLAPSSALAPAAIAHQAPAPAPSTAPVFAPAPAVPAVPVRAVRSSWLSKAIAAGSVPVNSASDARKSVVAQARPTLHNDFAGLRKSLAPPNGLKRKSEEGAGDDETARPDKIFKVEEPRVTLNKPIFDRQPSYPSTHTTSSALNAPPASNPSAPAVHPALSAAEAETNMQTPIEILKVTQKLEDMKQRSQAKELAKQKAAAAVAAGQGSSRTRELTNGGGGGFFKGLTKSLGIGARTETPEEEEERLQRELEEDRRAEAEAQAELDRLMRGDKAVEPEPETEPEARHEPLEEIKVVAHQPRLAKPARSTTPLQSPIRPATIDTHLTSDKTEQEDDEEEEEEVVEALSFIEVDEPLKEEPESPVQKTIEQASASRQPASGSSSSNKQDGQALAPPRLATPPRVSDFRMSTTPKVTPPRAVRQQHQQPACVAPALHDRAEKHDRSPAAKRPKSSLASETTAGASTTPVGQPKQEMRDPDSDTESDEEEEEEPRAEEEDRRGVTEHVKRVLPTKQAMASTRPPMPTSASSTSLAPLAPSSQGLLNQASTIAAKTLGVKPAIAPVKSVQLAQAAAKKEQDAAARMQNLRDQAEARRQEAARKKQEEERAKAAEAERVRRQELERGQKLRAELDRKKAERDAQMAVAMKQQAERQQKEVAAAKAKAAEEEANRKRKMAPMLTKSVTANPAKRPPPSSGHPSGQSQAQANKARETFRPTSSVKGPSAAPAGASSNGPAKLGPTSFRTAPAPEPAQSTVRLVNANPAHLGPPSRPSGMTTSSHTHPHPQWSHVPTNASGPSNILQQQRAVMQNQLDDKALEAQSEDIVLPDINSEYSDSDDSEKSTDFKRPEWAESPELRAALERQATRNPDELFGPIKPISMEELFKVKVSKFRPRSSSANWASGDGVTRKEELEYARRMGFKSGGGNGNSNARGEGSSGGVGGAF